MVHLPIRDDTPRVLQSSKASDGCEAVNMIIFRLFASGRPTGTLRACRDFQLCRRQAATSVKRQRLVGRDEIGLAPRLNE